MNIPDLFDKLAKLLVLQHGSQTYSNQLILSSGGQILAVRAEADASDVEITSMVDVLILKDTNLLARINFVDLGRSIASSGNISAVGAEPHAANNTLVLQGMNKLHINHARHRAVEDDPPVVSDLLEILLNPLWVKVA